MKKKIVICISWFLVLFWMGVIFHFSGMESRESNLKSMGTINKMISTTVDTTNKVGITDSHPSEERKAKIVEDINVPLRKCVHASIYLVLCLLTLNALIMSDCPIKKALKIGILICFLYACSDEFHQTFVRDRDGNFIDVLIDTTGSVVGLGIYYFGYLKYLQMKEKKEEILV